MAIKPHCDRCKKELNEFGAILLSPPNMQNEVQKYHLCKTCYELILNDFWVQKNHFENGYDKI